MISFRIISIGTLSKHELWDQDPGGRTPHATTTLIQTGDANILVDPGLPGQALAARLQERAGLLPNAITHVFCTSFRPAHRWGIQSFPDAQWLIFERERELVGQHLVEQFRNATDDTLKETLRQEIELLQRFKAAEDSIVPGVDLFPLPGYTPGTCGVLLPMPTHTVLIAGDGVLTGEHLAAGRVSPEAHDYEQAKESLSEALEIAEVIVPGHDNVQTNPVRRPF